MVSLSRVPGGGAAVLLLAAATLSVQVGPAAAQTPAPAPAAGSTSGGDQTPRQACAADFKTFCSGVAPGQGRIIACLQQNHDKLSAPCQQALATAKANRQARPAGQ